MKKIEKSSFAFAVAIAFSFAALNVQAQGENDEKGLYVEAGAASLQLKYGTTYSYNLGTTYPIYAGYKLDKNLAVEILYAHTSTADYSTSLDFGGVFVKPKLPLNQQLELFGRIGYNNVSLSNSYNGTISKSFVAFGGGLTAYLTDDKKNFISADYMRWMKNNGYTLSGVGLTYGRGF